MNHNELLFSDVQTAFQPMLAVIEEFQEIVKRLTEVALEVIRVMNDAYEHQIKCLMFQDYTLPFNVGVENECNLPNAPPDSFKVKLKSRIHRFREHKITKTLSKVGYDVLISLISTMIIYLFGTLI